MVKKVVVKRIVRKQGQDQNCFKCSVCEEEKCQMTFDICLECKMKNNVTICDCCKEIKEYTDLADDVDRRYYYEMGLYYDICRDCVSQLQKKTEDRCGRVDKDGYVCDNVCCEGYEYCSDCLEIEIFG